MSERKYLNDEATSAAKRLTVSSLRQLESDEISSQGCVQPLVVFFEDGRDDEQINFMRTAAISAENRRTRHYIAQSVSDQTQTAVRDLLRDGDFINSCFARSPNFRFDSHRHIVTLSSINALVVQANIRLAERIAEFENVLAVQTDFPIESIFQGELTAPLDNLTLLGEWENKGGHEGEHTWGWETLQVPETRMKWGLDGDGVTIGIANSGLADHEDLHLKVQRFAKVTPSGIVEDSFSDDWNGHGTHIAGICVGENNSGVWLGGAPRSDLAVVSVIGEGHGTYVSLLCGLEWLVDDARSDGKKPADLINLSLGFPKGLSSNALKQAERVFVKLSEQTVALVGAIGNAPQSPMYPALFDSVLSCGAIRPDQDLWPRSVGNPDFLLPGERIYSCVPAGLPKFHGQTHVPMSGTSMAAAHMSAIVALMVNANQKLERNKTPAELIEALKGTASKSNGGGTRSQYGIPDLQAAIEALMNK